MPADFSDKRDEYYDSLTLPLKAKTFVDNIKCRLKEALQELNDTLPDNESVEILAVKRGRIRLAKLKAQKKPPNLGYLKNEVRRRWWMTSLLDILKEAELRIGFTNSFRSLTGQERLPRDELRKRLLLCLYGLDTNTGLTSVSMDNHDLKLAPMNQVVPGFWYSSPGSLLIKFFMVLSLSV